MLNVAEKIRVLSKRPGQPPRSVWMANSLRNFQTAVGGYIETVTIATDLVVICNEEGRLLGLPNNCEICGVDFVGDIIIAGVKGEEFADLPISYQQAKETFSGLWGVGDGKK